MLELNKMVSEILAASVINIKPINSKKASPSIWSEGRLLINRLIGFENHIIIEIEIITAAIIIKRA